MKTETRIKRYAFITLLMVLILLSVSIALITYRYYGVVARGILGLVLMYLLFFLVDTQIWMCRLTLFYWTLKR